jgi:hypothetical protein
MACGITSDYIYQRMKSTEKDSKKGFTPNFALLLDEDESGDVEDGGDKEEVKGGADGR